MCISVNHNNVCVKVFGYMGHLKLFWNKIIENLNVFVYRFSEFLDIHIQLF